MFWTLYSEGYLFKQIFLTYQRPQGEFAKKKKKLLSFKETHILSALSYIRITGVSISLESITKENFLTLSCTVLMSPLLCHTIFSKKQFVTVIKYPIIMHYLARREGQAVHWFQFTGVCFYWFLSSVNLNVFIVISWPHLHWKCYQETKCLTSWLLPPKNYLLKIQHCGFIMSI